MQKPIFHDFVYHPIHYPVQHIILIHFHFKLGIQVHFTGKSPYHFLKKTINGAHRKIRIIVKYGRKYGSCPVGKFFIVTV